MKTQYTPSQLSLMEKAAPDLLEALEFIRKDKMVMRLSLESIKKLVEALSKATGE